MLTSREKYGGREI